MRRGEKLVVKAGKNDSHLRSSVGRIDAGDEFSKKSIQLCSFDVPVPCIHLLQRN